MTQVNTVQMPPSAQTAHISKESTFEHWPLDADGNRLVKDGVEVVMHLRFGKINMSALAELEEHLRRETLQLYLPQIEGISNPGIQAIMIEKAIALGDKRRIGMPEFDAAVETVGGVAYLTYLSLRKAHPEMNPRLAMKVFSDINASGRIIEFKLKLFSATGFDTGKAQAGQKDSTEGNQSLSTSEPPTSN